MVIIDGSGIALYDLPEKQRMPFWGIERISGLG